MIPTPSLNKGFISSLTQLLPSSTLSWSSSASLYNLLAPIVHSFLTLIIGLDPFRNRT